MSKAERNILRYLGMMAIIPKLIRDQGDPSKTTKKILAQMDSAFDTTRALYPKLFNQSKDIKKIAGEINILENKKQVHLLFLTSICLGGFEDAAQRLKADRLQAVIECIIIINRLHNYFDRKLNHYVEYKKATKIINQWEE